MQPSPSLPASQQQSTMPPPPALAAAWMEGLSRRDVELGTERMRSFLAAHQQQQAAFPPSSHASSSSSAFSFASFPAVNDRSFVAHHHHQPQLPGYPPPSASGSGAYAYPIISTAPPHPPPHQQLQQQSGTWPAGPSASPQSAVLLPSISQFLDPHPPETTPHRPTHVSPQQPTAANKPTQSPSTRRIQGHAVDPLSSPPSSARRKVGPTSSPSGSAAAGGSSGSSGSRRRRSAGGRGPVAAMAVELGSPVGKTRRQEQQGLRPKPSLESVLQPQQQASRPASAQQARAGKAERETSVGSDASSEFDILAPYISRPAVDDAQQGGDPSSPSGPADGSQQKTPLRSSTSLPALLADFDSSSDDEDEGVSRGGASETFTPRRRSRELRTPSGSSLLDSVLSGGAGGGEARRQWSLRRATPAGGGRPIGVGGSSVAHSPYGLPPPSSAGAAGNGSAIARSHSFPSHLALGSTSSFAPPPLPLSQPVPSTSAMTPLRPYHSSTTVNGGRPPTTANTLADAYAARPLDLSRSPGGILTPYRPSATFSAASAGPGGLAGRQAGSGGGGHHRREPSRAETECYWQSSPSDSTQAVEETDEGQGEIDGGRLLPSDDDEDGEELSELEDDDDVEEGVRRDRYGPGSIRSPPAASSTSTFAGQDLTRPGMSSAAVAGATSGRPAPIRPLLFQPHPTSSSSSATDDHRPNNKPASATSSSFASAHATADDGRSTSSDKENRARDDDVFGGEAGSKPSALGAAAVLAGGGVPTVVVARPPSASSAPGAGDNSKGKKKKGLSGTPSLTSPVIQECDLPPVNIPAGPRSSAKPAFSYAAMIGQAILAHPRARLSLAEIYTWIAAAYPFYRKGEAGWMNSIRHNLSLNKCFVKVERDKPRDGAAVVVGKGMLWAIEPGCEHQFEGGGFSKSGKPPVGKVKAATAVAPGRSKSSTPVPSNGKSKKRKADATTLAAGEDSVRPSSPPPRAAQLPPVKRLKLKVALDSSPHVYDVSPGLPPSSPADSSDDGSDESPEVGTLALPSLAAAFAPRDGSQYPTLPVPRAMLYGASAFDRQPARDDDGSNDDYATPQRPLSRGPPSAAAATAGGRAAMSSSQEMPPPASCLRGLPHLTPSVSSPASSSPAQPFVPRPRAIQAHQALLRSSLGQPENITIVDDAPAYDAGLSPDASGSSSTAVPAGLQPGFQIAKASTMTSPRPGPASPTSNRFHSSMAPGIQSPMSSLRATAHDDDAAAEPSTHDPHAWRAPTANPGYGGYSYSQGGHLSPLHNRKLSAGGGSSALGQERGRGLSATGELVNHALRDPLSAGATFKTPGMQPIAASPRQTLPRPWAFQMAGGPPSPAGGAAGLPRRTTGGGGGMLLSNATPKGMSLSSYGLSASTPARTPISHPTQSPAGAALLQRRAELGMLGAELTYGDDDVSSTPGGSGGASSSTSRRRPSAVSGDPYDSGSAVEHELRHIHGSAVNLADSPGGPTTGWGGGGGRTLATPGRGVSWIDEPEPSPGMFSPGRPRYVFR